MNRLILKRNRHGERYRCGPETISRIILQANADMRLREQRKAFWNRMFLYTVLAGAATLAYCSLQP